MAFEHEELNQRREERAKEKAFAASQKRILRIGMLLMGIVLVLCAGAFLVTWMMVRQNTPQTPTQPPTTQAPTQTVPPETVPDTVIHFVAGGDLNVTDKVVTSGALANGYDFTDTLLDVAPLLADANLSAVNFEGSIYGPPYGTKYRSAPTQLLNALQQAGVDLLQAANSQTVVNGLSGMQQTLQSVQAAGMEPVGAYATAEEFRRSGGYTIRDIQGVKVAVVAFTKGMDGMGLPTGSEDCVNLLYQDYNSAYQKVDTKGIQAVLRAAKAHQPDIIIALLHWGSEYNATVSKTQKTITNLMFEEGVDAIIGTHSHYVQEITFDPAAGTLVAYGLGDFLGDGEKNGTNYSILLDLEITKDGATGETTLTGYSYTPIFIADETASGGSLRLLRMREAIAAYESSYIGGVSEPTYRAMLSAMERLEARLEPEKE